jgi:hypothetical protein
VFGRTCCARSSRAARAQGDAERRRRCRPPSSG